jgi:hypothetical protein
VVRPPGPVQTTACPALVPSSNETDGNKMNERIRELAKAHLVRDEYTESGWQECHKYSFDEDELEKFAELIVRECIDKAFHNGHPDLEFLLKHFGVEL